MNAPAIQMASIAFGTPLEGGFYAGRLRLPDGECAVIVSPRAEGYHDDIKWGPVKRVAGAMSFFDGLANTKAMAEAGSKAAQWALGLSIGGFSDWYIPSRGRQGNEDATVCAQEKDGRSAAQCKDRGSMTEDR